MAEPAVLLAKTNLTEYGLFVVDVERRKKWIKLLIYIGLVAGTFAAYEPIRKNDFVSYDDHAYVTENPGVNGGITRQSVIWAFTKTRMANWHPLTWLSHMLDCEIFGLNPLGHHITSVLIHTANALLLFCVLLKMTGATWPSAFVAAAFALHPVHVESVAWVAERKDVLSVFFWLLTMLAYVQYVDKPTVQRYVTIIVLYALGLMAKPMLVTLPFVFLLLDYWPLNRLNSKFSILNSAIEKVPFFALSAASSIITFFVQQSAGAVVALQKIPLDQRIANMFISYVGYIGKTIWPSRLAVYYPHLHANSSNVTVAVCTLLLVLISVFTIYIGRRRKYLAVGWLWYIGTLVPVVGLVQVGSQAMADRYMYMPMLGLLIIAAWAVNDLVADRPRWKVVAAVLAPLALASVLMLTRMQIRYWQNSITLFEHALNVTKNNELAEAGYGNTLFEAGRLNEAVLHLSNAVRISPTFSKARSNLGKVYLKQGKLNEAIACFNEVIKDKHDSAEAYYNLAVALTMQKKYDDAVKYFAAALRIDPMFTEARNRMGSALLAAGKWEQAIVCFKEVLQSTGEKADACANLGLAYSQIGNHALAIENWTKAVQLKPDSSGTLNNLAWLLATADNTELRDPDKAVALATRACELTAYKDAESLDTLAAAYAAAGKFPDAVATAESALNAAKAATREDLASEIQNRLELYRAARPYRGK